MNQLFRKRFEWLSVGLCVLGIVLAGCAGDNKSVAIDGDADTAENETGGEIPGETEEDASEEDSIDIDTDTETDAEADMEPDILEEAEVETEPEPETDIGPEADPDPEPEPEPETEAEPECITAEPFDYTCDMQVPETCPGGMCVAGFCVGPVLNPDRYVDCGNGTCDPCENADVCPADCGESPVMTGTKDYDNDTTITVWVHGFYNKSASEIESMVYGESRGCSGILEEFSTYGINRPCGDTPEGEQLPNHLDKIEYYGAVPAPWFTQNDIDEIEQYSWEGIESLDRYSLILAKFIRHKLTVSGATHVNLTCHSMGCLVTRNMIEHDLEGLASENRFVRWTTSAGVIAGARLARLYDNPTVRDTAALFGLALADFVIMNPDYVMDHVAAWDHNLYQGNNPLFADMILHHTASCDTHIAEALNIELLELNNPTKEPNDGIMYTFDTYFHYQKPEVALHTPDMREVQPTHSFLYVDHMTNPDTDGVALLMTANTFHRRKVRIRLQEIRLWDDRENHAAFDGEHGTAPAEVVVTSKVRFNPYVLETFGKDVLVHDDQIDYRTPYMLVQDMSQVLQPNLPVFEGPVLDEMTQIQVDMKVMEVDQYDRFGLAEWLINPNVELVGFNGLIDLSDQTFEVSSDFATITISVEVLNMY